MSRVVSPASCIVALEYDPAGYTMTYASCLLCEVYVVMLVVVSYTEPVPPGEKCIIPECTRKRYSDGSVAYHYCSKSHADAGRQRGIYREFGAHCAYIYPHLFTLRPFPSLSPLACMFLCLYTASAQDPKDQCDLPNCTRPKAVEANGYKYNYCCRDHALKDGEGGTVSIYYACMCLQDVLHQI